MEIFIATGGDAILLKNGDKLHLSENFSAQGERTKTSTIWKIQTVNKIAPVYNLEVSNSHTFFVGDIGTLVHNPIRPGQTTQRHP